MVLAGVSSVDGVDSVDKADGMDCMDAMDKTGAVDVRSRAFASAREPIGLVERNVALFQVMLSRAQAALGIARLTDDTRARTLNYQMHATRIGALVQAQLHIARELRQWLKLLPGFDPRAAQAGRGTPKPMPPDKPKGLPMRMLDVLQETEGFLELALGLPPGEKSAFSPRLPTRNPPPDPASA